MTHQESTSMWHPKSILLSGIPKDYTSLPDTHVTIRRFFEDNSLSGGGAVCENGIQVTSSKQDVLVEFELYTDAAEVIKQAPHRVMIGDLDCQLHVLRCPLTVYNKYYIQGQHTAPREASAEYMPKKKATQAQEESHKTKQKHTLKTDIDKSFQAATIKDAELVAERVLVKKTVIFNGTERTVTQQVEQIWDRRIVFVTGFAAMSAEALVLLYENQKKSGGGLVEAVVMVENAGGEKAAFVTFENEADAARALEQGTLTRRDGSVVKAEIPDQQQLALLPTNQNNNTSPGNDTSNNRFGENLVSNNSISVSGLDDSVMDNMLEMLFEDDGRFGGGAIESLAIDPESGTNSITFEKDCAVESVLSRHEQKTLFFGKREITVHSLNNNPRANSDDDYRPQGALSLPSTKKSCSRSIEVLGFGDDITTEYLHFYFSSSLPSNGGEIEHIDHSKEKKKAIIKFKHESTVESVLSKHQETPLHIGRREITIQPLYNKTQVKTLHHKTSLKGEAKNVVSKTPDETKETAPAKENDRVVLNCIENNKKTGGGGLESGHHNSEQGTAVITFRDEAICSVKTTERSSSEKGKHCMSNSAMDMNQTESTYVFSSVEGNVGSGALARFQHQLSEEPIQTEIEVNPDTMEYIRLFFHEDLHGMARNNGVLLDDTEAVEGRIKLMSSKGKPIPEDAIQHVRKHIQDLYVDVISTRVNTASICHKLKSKWREIIKCGRKYKAWIKDGDREIVIVAKRHVIDVVVDEVNKILGIAPEMRERESYVVQNSKSNIFENSELNANYQQSMQTQYSQSFTDKLPQIGINCMTQREGERHRQRLMFADSYSSNFPMQESNMDVHVKSKFSGISVPTPMKYKTSSVLDEALMRGEITMLHGNAAHEDYQVPTSSHRSATASLEPFSLENLNPYGSEYNEISEKFLTSLNLIKIRKIQRVQNPSLYQKFLLHKTHMDENNTGNTMNERRLWHGTGAETLAEINTNGFNRSFCGKNGTKYGKGVYFATHSSKAVSYAKRNPCGERYVYYCRVLTGEFTMGERSYLVPPAKDSRRPNIKYDSVVDNTVNPSMFVVFHDTQAFPEYLITFI